MEAAASLTGGYLYSLRIKRGSCVKGSTSAAFTVQVDARIETVLDLKCTLLEQHPELSAGGEPQLQILGQGGRGGRATLPDAAHLTTLRLEQQCTASTPGGKPAASLMVNQGELVPEEEMSFAAADADTVTAALAGDGEGSAVGGGLLTGSLLERLAAASIAAAPALQLQQSLSALRTSRMSWISSWISARRSSWQRIDQTQTHRRRQGRWGFKRTFQVLAVGPLRDM